MIDRVTQTLEALILAIEEEPIQFKVSNPL